MVNICFTRNLPVFSITLVFRVILVRIFDAFGRNTERYFVFSQDAGKYGKSADQNNSEYGHFLRSVWGIYCVPYQQMFFLMTPWVILISNWLITLEC